MATPLEQFLREEVARLKKLNAALTEENKRLALENKRLLALNQEPPPDPPDPPAHSPRNRA